MTLTRRAALRAIAVSPAAAHVVGEQMKMTATAGITPYHALGRTMPSPPSGEISPAEATRFTSFADWFKRIGHKDILRNASYVAALDPDIVEMRLPLQTKYRLQRARQVERAIAQRKEEFDEAISAKGFFSWWL